MAGLVPAIHAVPPQRRVWYWWYGPPQRPTNARFFASAGCLAALDAPNHVDGRDKPGHDALKDPPAISSLQWSFGAKRDSLTIDA